LPDPLDELDERRSDRLLRILLKESRNETVV
jgi:hypothetical protein